MVYMLYYATRVCFARNKDNTQCNPPLSQPLSFPTVFANFQAAILWEHMSILRNMMVYVDIKIYCSNV